VVSKLLALYSSLEPHDLAPFNSSTINLTTTAQVFAARASALLGDLDINSAQRVLCRQSSQTSRCYSFVFDALPAWVADVSLGAPHGSEIGAVFQNAKEGEGYTKMSVLMGTMWAGFISHMDPMAGLHGKQEVSWPVYHVDKTETLVFDEERRGYTIKDQYREEAMNYISGIMSTVLDK
jgi:carboxylesterase type B